MAYPTNALTPNRQFRIGVPLALVGSSDPNADLEVWRKTTDSTGHTLHEVFRADSRGGIPSQYFDTQSIGLSTYSYSYKFRHVKVGSVASDYTTEIVTQPRMIEGRFPAVTPLGGVGIGADVRLSTSIGLKFGTPQAPKYAAKSLRLTASAFQPNRSTDSFVLDQDGLTGNIFSGLGGDNEAWADALVPIGADLTGVKLAARNNSTGDTDATLVLFKLTSTGGNSAVAAGVTAGSTGITSVTSTFSPVVSVTANDTYMVRVRLANSTNGVSRVYLRWVDVLYRVPSLNVGV